MICILPFVPLIVLIVSDIRHRSVSVWWLIVFALALWSAVAVTSGCLVALIKGTFNCCILFIIGVLLLLYSRARGKNLLEMLGFGDVLFLLIVSPVFESKDFMLYLIISCVLCLLVWPVFCAKQPYLKGVPFISVAGFCLIGFNMIQ